MDNNKEETKKKKEKWKKINSVFNELKSILSEGAPIKVACQYVGISDTYYFQFINDPENIKKREILERAQAECIRQALKSIKTRIVNANDGELALKFLAKKLPKEFGDRPEEEVTEANIIGGEILRQIAGEIKANFIKKLLEQNTPIPIPHEEASIPHLLPQESAENNSPEQAE